MSGMDQTDEADRWLGFCTSCGAYATTAPRDLLTSCRGRLRGKVRAEALARIAKGRHPHSTLAGLGARVDVRGRPTPNQLEWLARRWWARSGGLERQPCVQAAQQVQAAVAQAAADDLQAYGGLEHLAAVQGE